MCLRLVPLRTPKLASWFGAVSATSYTQGVVSPVWCLTAVAVSRAVPTPPTRLYTVLDDVTLVVNLCTLGQQTLTPLGAAACEDCATILGGHACAETELALAAALGRLVCSLAHSQYFFSFRSLSADPLARSGWLSYSKIGVCQAPFFIFFVPMAKITFIRHLPP